MPIGGEPTVVVWVTGTIDVVEGSPACRELCRCQREGIAQVTSCQEIKVGRFDGKVVAENGEFCLVSVNFRVLGPTSSSTGTVQYHLPLFGQEKIDGNARRD